MVSVREKDRVKDPPPKYSPRNVYVTVALHWDGEFKNEPIPHYKGGYVVKLDWVVAKQLGWDSLVNTAKEWAGDDVGKFRKFHILVGNAFRVLTSDDDVRKWAQMHCPLDEIAIYVDDVELDEGSISDGNQSDGGGIGGGEPFEVDTIGSVSEEEHVQAEEDVADVQEVEEDAADLQEEENVQEVAPIQTHGIRKGRTNEVLSKWNRINKGKGRTQSKEIDQGKSKDKVLGKGKASQGKGLPKEKVIDKGQGKALRKGKDKVIDKGKDKVIEDEFEDLDEFSDSDYNMMEISDDSDDDIFEEAVDDHIEDAVDDQIEEVVDYESSEGSTDEDVVATDNYFGEGKDSDEEMIPSYPVFNKDVMFDKPELLLGMIFSNRVDFKKAVQTQAVQQKRNIKFIKIAPDRVYARCRDARCGWKCSLLKCSPEETYQIRDYVPKHKCPPTRDVKNVKSSWLSEKFLRRFVSDPKRKISRFRQDVIDDIGCDVSKDQAYRARRLALKKLQGTPDAQFAKLWDYAAELERTNPGTTVMVATDEDEDGQARFSRFYVCLAAVKEGFAQGCRKIVGVDGCHLKGPHQGVLLTAVGIDGNNCLYPLAWAVVKSECNETWEWFLIALKHDLSMYKGSEWTFMSDKQKGLIHAFASVFPESSHRFCVRHLNGNFKSAGYRGEAYKEALWRAANATTEGEWKLKMDELKALSPPAHDWLAAKPASEWSKSHFSPFPQCDMLLNNVCESFNSSILEAREMPILTMLEWIREWLMIRYQRNRDLSQKKWKGKICPKVRLVLDKHIEWSGTCFPMKCDHHNYQVRGTDGVQYCVNLEEHTCTCRLWDLSGIPCRHAISAITHQKSDIEDYVADWYTVEVYKKSYAPSIKGINGEVLWKETCYIPPLPPNMRKGKGRPPRARRNEPDEIVRKSKKRPRGKKPTSMKRRQKTLSCKKCGKEGHNAISCGRPSKYKKSVYERGSTSNQNASRDGEVGDTPVQNEEDHGNNDVSNEVAESDDSQTQIGSGAGTVVGARTMLPPILESQEPASQIVDEELALEIPTQGSQAKQMVHGPTCWDKLQNAKRTRKQGGLKLVPDEEGGRKFIKLSELHKMAKGGSSKKGKKKCD